jgi:hypothetical protein
MSVIAIRSRDRTGLITLATMSRDLFDGTVIGSTAVKSHQSCSGVLFNPRLFVGLVDVVLGERLGFVVGFLSLVVIALDRVTALVAIFIFAVLDDYLMTRVSF